MTQAPVIRPWWWIVIGVATLANLWLLIQMLFVVAPGGNTSQAAIFLGVSLAFVGLPTLLVAIACLSYLLWQSKRKVYESKIENWRTALMLSTFDIAIPLLGAGLILAVRYGH